MPNKQLLLQEIHDAYAESESYHERWKMREASSFNGECLTIGSIVRGIEQDCPPYNQVDFIFESVALYGRHWRRLPVRLVEHAGSPGLVIFNPYGNAIAPLHHWLADGNEDGIDFMLIVARNKNSRRRLTSAPASDLILIRELAVGILGHLVVHGDGPDKRWSRVARRLIQEIDEIPERLHYDSVAVTLARDKKGAALVFNVATLYFRGRCARNFHFVWRPNHSGGTIEVHRSNAETSMIVSWTDNRETLTLGTGTKAEFTSTADLWRNLTSADQIFFKLLAKSLPDLLHHACEQHADLAKMNGLLIRQARIFSSRLRRIDRRQHFVNYLVKTLKK
jgi:hypothetical protein